MTKLKSPALCFSCGAVSLLWTALISLLLSLPANANQAENVLHKLHSDVSSDLKTFIVDIDSFFGDAGEHEDNSQLVFDFTVNSLYSREQKHSFNHKLRTKVRLDNLNKAVSRLNKRINLVIEPNDPLPENDKSRNVLTKKQTSSIHLDVSGFHWPRLKYQLGHNGFKAIFAGVSYDHKFRFNQSQFELDSAYRYTSEDVNQLVIEPSLSTRLSQLWQQTLYADYRYYSNQDFQNLAFGINWRRKLNHAQGVSLAVSSYATTEKGYEAKQHEIIAGHRSRVYSDWVFLDTQVFVQWQKSHRFKADPGIALGMNIYFGR